jgi:hypothetical protein
LPGVDLFDALGIVGDGRAPGLPPITTLAGTIVLVDRHRLRVHRPALVEGVPMKRRALAGRIAAAALLVVWIATRTGDDDARPRSSASDSSGRSPTSPPHCNGARRRSRERRPSRAADARRDRARHSPGDLSG